MKFVFQYLQKQQSFFIFFFNFFSSPIPKEFMMNIEILVNQHQELRSFEKKDRVQRIEMGIENVRSHAAEVSNELIYMKTREQKFRQTSDAIKFRLMGLHFGLVLLLIGTALWQMYSLKKFFKSKKLIE